MRVARHLRSVDVDAHFLGGHGEIQTLALDLDGIIGGDAIDGIRCIGDGLHGDILATDFGIGVETAAEHQHADQVDEQKHAEYGTQRDAELLLVDGLALLFGLDGTPFGRLERRVVRNNRGNARKGRMHGDFLTALLGNEIHADGLALAGNGIANHGHRKGRRLLHLDFRKLGEKALRLSGYRIALQRILIIFRSVTWGDSLLFPCFRLYFLFRMSGMLTLYLVSSDHFSSLLDATFSDRTF